MSYLILNTTKNRFHSSRVAQCQISVIFNDLGSLKSMQHQDYKVSMPKVNCIKVKPHFKNSAPASTVPDQLFDTLAQYFSVLIIYYRRSTSALWLRHTRIYPEIKGRNKSPFFIFIQGTMSSHLGIFSFWYDLKKGLKWFWLVCLVPPYVTQLAVIKPSPFFVQPAKRG